MVHHPIPEMGEDSSNLFVVFFSSTASILTSQVMQMPDECDDQYL